MVRSDLKYESGDEKVARESRGEVPLEIRNPNLWCAGSKTAALTEGGGAMAERLIRREVNMEVGQSGKRRLHKRERRESLQSYFDFR